MTVDTSAVLAVILMEEEYDEFLLLLEDAPRRLISAVSVLEAAMVLDGRRRVAGSMTLDVFLREALLEIVPFDGKQLEVARLAFRRFGKGRHPAGLNFGDCAAYALSQVSGEPLLFKGEDFAATDVARARV